MSQADKDNHLESILKRYKPDNLSKLPLDIQYLMGDEINLVLSEGFNVLYRTQPHHPIDFFAKWLLNYEATQKNKQTVHQNDVVLKDTIQKYDEAAEVRRKQEAEQEAQRKLHEKHETQFRDKLKAHDYHEELLNNDLPSFIEKQKGLPAVYIGVLEHPSRAIADDEEDEFAHLETGLPKVINYLGASGSQKFLVGRELPLGKGVTYSVFEAKPVDPAAAEGQENVAPPQPKYLYIPDVTKEPRIFYFRIPKLGAYMACPMSYNSVLSEKAFDAGVAERERVLDEQKRQGKDKEERDADYEQRIKEAQEGELETKEIEDEWKNFEWPKITEGEFLSEEKKFVVCIDTLGEDREITQLERDYITELIQTFVNNWEESEKRQLSKDVDLYLQIQAEVNKEEFLEDLEKRLEEFLTAKPQEEVPVEGEGGEPIEKKEEKEEPQEEEEESEEKQNYKKAVKTTEFYKKVLVEDKVKNMIKALSGYRVIKFKALIQNIMYFLGYKKGQVNIPGTNVLDWKEVKKTISRDDFFRRLEEYEYKGPKEGYWERYGLTHKLAQKLEKFRDEDLEEYNLGLAVLYKYVKQAIATRLLDIELRKNKKAEERAAREELIQKDQEWVQTRETELETARNKAAEEEQEFNQEEWEANWIEQNPRVEIPPEVIDDIDEDILEQD